METAHNYLKGDWKLIKEYDDDLVNKNLDIGEIYFASQLIYWRCYPYINQGNFEKAKLLINKLCRIGEVYENNSSLLLKYNLNDKSEFFPFGIKLDTVKFYRASKKKYEAK